MPTLDFKGKNHIYAHHLTVPYRPLQLDESRSLLPSSQNGDVPLTDQNLIIHGDNLHALKALLPHYSGRVKCIYIDPPYNTGSQEWIYNDRVNSPMMQAWLAKNSPVDSEDLERHDKWMCMMWPRMHLLRELLRDDGVIFVSIDDNEQWRLLGMMEEIFGEENFIATLSYTQNLGALPGRHINQVTEYVHIFAKEIDSVELSRIPIDTTGMKIGEDEHGLYREGFVLNRSGHSANRADRPNLYFPIFVARDLSISLQRRNSSDVEVFPTHADGSDAVWRWGKERIGDNLHNILVKRHRRTEYQFLTKIRPDAHGGKFTSKPRSLWMSPKYSASNGTNTIKAIFNNQRIFDYPKSVDFVADIVRFGSTPLNGSHNESDIILDSFAGSGTTAHAVLALNKEDGGNRRFILVECEDYADSITAERIRRVIRGVPKAKDKQLKEGLGGSFAYCTLGEAIDVDSLLEGGTLPSYSDLASYLLHTATGISASPRDLNSSDTEGHFFSSAEQDYYLIYEPSVGFLRSGDAALNLERAERIREKGRSAVVFAAADYIGQRQLSQWDIIFCQLPYELGFGG